MLLDSEGLMGDGDMEDARAEGEGVKEEERQADLEALFGSHGPKHGGACELLYSQFELFSPVAKKHQIILLQVRDVHVCA